MKSPVKISVILPCLNEAKNLPLLIPEIINNIPKKYSFEIICINDGSTDETEKVIRKISEKEKRVKGVFFYRRFGLQQALRAGIEKAGGQAIITMDADFQHPPQLIERFIKLWEDGHDVIQAQKLTDNTSSVKKSIFRKIGYAFWNYLSDGILVPGASDFRLIDKSIADYIKDCPENQIYLRGIVQLIAKNPINIPYSVQPRLNGHSSFTFSELMGIFLNGIISFSIKPLRFAWIVGLCISILSALYIIIDLIYALLAGNPIISGYKTLVLLMLILNGFIIFYLGVLGEYIGVIFKEIKKRPHYKIDKFVNLK